MTSQLSASEEPHHRQWLHAMESEPTVPGTVLQVARVYADYAASRGGRSASVSYPALIRQTHRSRGTLVEAHEWMTDHGWLRLRPGKDGEPWRDGQRKTHDLTFGGPGKKRDPVRLLEGSETPNRSSSRNGRAPKRFDDRNGSAKGNRSGSRTATVLATETEPFQSPKRERLTSDNVSSLPAPGSLHAQLAAVVPDVTERETELVIQMLGDRPAVQSGSAVLPREIRDGNGADLVDKVRRRTLRPPPDSLSDQRPAAVQFRDQCPRCSRPGHGTDNCPEAAARPAPTAETPCAAGENCHQRHTDVPYGHEYHKACQTLGDLRAPRDGAKHADHDEVGRRIAAEQLAEMRAAEPARDGGHAA